MTQEELTQCMKELQAYRQAVKELLNAEHYDHFAARMSDSELDALEKLKALARLIP